MFKHQVSEYSALEGDADIDDDPIIEEVDEEQDEESAEEEQKKRKPWGDAKHFCPVALKEQGQVLYSQPMCIDVYNNLQKYSGQGIKIMLCAIVRNCITFHLRKPRKHLQKILLPT